MPQESHRRLVEALTSRGYNAEREAVTLLADAGEPELAAEAAAEAAGDAFVVTAAHAREALDGPLLGGDPESEATPDEPSHPEAAEGAPDLAAKAPTDMEAGNDSTPADELLTEEDEGSPATGGGEDEGSSALGADDDEESSPDADSDDTNVSTGSENRDNRQEESGSGAETKGSTGEDIVEPSTTAEAVGDRSPPAPEIRNDVTGRSTGTGEYEEFVGTFQDRYDRLAGLLRGRVNHRPAEAIQSMPGGSDAEMIGLVDDIRSTASGHWIVELEDTTGTFPCLIMKDRAFAPLVDDLLLDECLAVQGTLADDGGIMFVDSLHFPDVPRTHKPNTADRHVQAALISDIHVGSQEFAQDAWDRFAEWLHTPEAEAVEYLLIGGDMVEGVGVYPDQDEELDVVDIYDQYETFAEELKKVPGDMEIVMIPGNHDAVRLAEPQPAFTEELRDIMSAHDARFTGNPSTVTVEGVSVLMYHGVSLDEVIAELPEEKASYDDPHKAMYQLLKKRHVAPQYGGHTRVAPEEKDYLVIDEVPDVFHTGHVHKLGWGKYHNVLAVNSGCWQEQTDFQKSVNIDPDYGYAPILDLDTLDMTVRKFV
ncbi:DNA-directed DNA polymerase II small subunit [Halolamina sp. CBA1230]|uniref:DNA-directed DNA polymerase II small subunit n=1 Tax=Halolamina sp. CBA1230 TaxID=1853690 RepID=UPI0009A1B185|nr:DNA-directed DNA polymerase II small subunit [Halolamina sp. CBA1230]QKY20706.1 DNA-directed DNA polymerase II small subunit [Halolamina sp. CBA1230]